MIVHLLRALFRRIDARLDRMVADALDDDLCAVMDATAEPEVAQMHRQPTPLADGAMEFLRSSMAALDAMDTVEDFLWLAGEEQ